MKIIGFYFAALMLDNWYEIINEQIINNKPVERLKLEIVREKKMKK